MFVLRTLRGVSITSSKSVYSSLPKKSFSLASLTVNTNLSNNERLNLTNSPIFTQFRTYAKGKDKKKEKGKTKVVVNETQLTEYINIDSMKKQMERVIEQLKDDFIKHLSLRSTTGSIETIPVSLDGKEHTLQELAQIVRKNTKTIVINMALFPQAIPAALKAMEKSGMNLNPQQDGTTLYVPIPKVTKEHRESLTKNAKQLFVKCKDGIRDVQIKYVKQVKKKGDLSQDIGRNIEAQVISIADGYITQGEKIFESKCQELIGKE